MAAHEKDKPEPKSHKHDSHDAGHFVRAGGQLVNLAHVAQVLLPVDGDPKQPLTLTFATGTNLTLTGEDAAAVLAALAECCDVTPNQPHVPHGKAAKPE